MNLNLSTLIKRFAHKYRIISLYYYFLKCWYSLQILIKEFVFNKILYSPIYDVDNNNLASLKLLKYSLNSRGITWPIKSDLNPHIVYASIPSVWELENIPESLNKITSNVSYYYTKDFNLDFFSSRSKAIKLNDILFYDWVVEQNNKCKIDVIITYFSGGEISSSTIRKIRNLGIPIFTFHLDDRLHFFGRLVGFKFSGPFSVCRSYDLNLSSCIHSLNQYRFFNSNVYYWPEGANTDFFKPNFGSIKKYDVVFVGSKYGARKQLVEFLLKKGINVTCFGRGWDNGSISSSDYIDIVNQSKIVLGLGYISFTKYQTLKGRDFEIPSCGALYLTTHNEELGKLFEIDKEIVTYNNFNECYDKILYYLRNESAAFEIQINARNKVVTSHSWEKRFREILFE